MISTLNELNELGWFFVALAVVLVISGIVSGVKLWKDFTASLGLKSVSELEKEQTKKDIKILQDSVIQLKNDFESYKKDKDCQYHTYHDESVHIREELVTSMNDYMKEISKALNEIKEDALTEKIERMRWKILDFASQIRNGRISYPEQFNNVLKTYDEYEHILDKHNLTNGQVDESIKFIKEKYHEMLKCK